MSRERRLRSRKVRTESNERKCRSKEMRIGSHVDENELNKDENEFYSLRDKIGGDKKHENWCKELRMVPCPPPPTQIDVNASTTCGQLVPVPILLPSSFFPLCAQQKREKKIMT